MAGNALGEAVQLLYLTALCATSMLGVVIQKTITEAQAANVGNAKEERYLLFVRTSM